MTAETPNAITSGADIAAYAALRSAAVWFEASPCWSAFRGDKAADSLNGLVTNDVSTLAVGASLYAAALTPKSKLVTDMMIVRLDSTTFLINVLPAAADAWLALARKYVNPRLAKVSDESARYRAWTVFGPTAVEASEHVTTGTSALRVGMPPLGSLPGMLVLCDSMATTEDVQHRLASSSVAIGSPALWEVARVEAGRPAIGVDMDDNTIPQEANLDTLGAISFSKGCYTGQETVARVHFRGHVNKHLRGLIGGTALPVGAEVTDADGKLIGDVRSSVHSPRFGFIAMAMIRRDVTAGSPVTVVRDALAMIATLVDLPFASSGAENQTGRVQ